MRALRATPRHRLAIFVACAAAFGWRASAQTRDASVRDAAVVPSSARDAGARDAAPGDASADAAAREEVQASAEDVPGIAVRRGRAETVLDAPFDAVVRVMTDYAGYAQVMPYVRESRVVHRDHAMTDVYLQVPLRPSLGVLWSLVRITARRTPGRVELEGRAADGNIDRFETSAIIERVSGSPGRTRMVFTILAVPRLPFPSSVYSREMVDAARTVGYNVRTRVARALADAG